MKQKVVYRKFHGGSSDSEKEGKEFSNRFAQNCNIFEDPHYLTINPKPAKVSGSTVDGLVKWAVDTSPWSTDRYFYAKNGDMYKETSAGTWSMDEAVASAGQGLGVYDNYLYYADSTKLGRNGPLNGTPAYSDDFLTDGVTDVDDSLSTSGQTYTVATSIAETVTHRQTLQLTKDPMVSITILVADKGTGDWTVTLHDSFNTVIGAKTLVNASVANGDVVFTFAAVLRINLEETYHFHVTSTVADGTVTTTTAADLETVDFSTLYDILIVDANFHPISTHQGQLVIGNERYLATFDGGVYNPNALILASGFSVRSLAKQGEYLAIGCWRGTDVEGVENGRIYWWDGVSSSWNYFKKVPGGLVNALHTDSKDRLLGILGSRGELYEITPEGYRLIQEPPKLARGKKMEVYPGAMTEWQGKTQIGYGFECDDASFYRGIYTYGSKRDEHPDVMNLGYTISTGNLQDVDIDIGMVKAMGKDMYIGWLDANGTTFGVDKIIKSNNPYTSALWESLIFDNGDCDKEKLAVTLRIKFDDLISGQSVTPKYKIDRAASWTTGTVMNTAADTQAEIVIDLRFEEIEFGFNLVTSGSNFPKIKQVQFLFDDLSEEESQES